MIMRKTKSTKTKHSNLTIELVSEYFYFHQNKFKRLPNKEIQGWVFKFTLKEDFNSILVNLGIEYLLVVLDIFEKSNKFLECSKILTLINNYNKFYHKKYPTHINQYADKKKQFKRIFY